MDKPWYKDKVLWVLILVFVCAQVLHVVMAGHPQRSGSGNNMSFRTII